MVEPPELRELLMGSPLPGVGAGGDEIATVDGCHRGLLATE
jgi:hypothetical protein